ncbi:MAG TPA: M20/M25/M40 family metallo-hydrolase [Terriglobales bacterium]|jgi:acetylornithine deacetylase/succinyl-diaminopimelate desuccinylase-like protein|nr:M20/M25/M40 family metallo-hydrolase [Terriglobales bacterium]
MPPAAKAPAAPATSRQEVARIAELRPVHAALGWFRSHERELADRQVELARIPAPPFGEQARAVWLRDRFQELGLKEAHIDEAGNVLGVRPGAGSQENYVALAAHIDTVFPAGTPLDIRREGSRLFGPGVSDNGAGVVALLALAAALQAAELRHTAPILFLGDVGEEGEGDLRGMRHLFSDPRWKDAIAYTLVLDGASTDTVVTEGLGSRRFEVSLQGPGGHSWSDFGAPNPVVILAHAIALFSRVQVPSEPKTSYNVGIIGGGTSVNSIPESASMRVDLRSIAAGEIDRLERALREAVSEAVAEGKKSAGRGKSGEIGCEIKLIGSRPAAELKPGARILEVVEAVDAHLGNYSRPHRASTDANIPLSLGREAVGLGAGGSGGGAHTLHEWYDPTGRDLGLKRILLAALTLTGVSE